LGKPDTTVKELIEMKGLSAKLKEEIDNVFEVLAYVQAVNMNNYSGNEEILSDGLRWEISAHPEYVIEKNEANCFAMANTVAYLLEGDYEEVGVVWWSIPHYGGHLYNYVKYEGEYYIFSALAYTMPSDSTPGVDGYPGYENGADNGYTGNLRGLVHQILEDENGNPNFDPWFKIEKDFHENLTFMAIIPTTGFAVIGSHGEDENAYHVATDFPLDKTIIVRETPVYLTKNQKAPEWKRGLYE